MTDENISMLLAIRGDEPKLINHFKEHYSPVNEYKAKLDIPQSVVLILGLSSSPNDSSVGYFKVTGDSLVPVSEEQFSSLRREAIQSNSCLYNTNRAVAEKSPLRFLTV